MVCRGASCTLTTAALAVAVLLAMPRTVMPQRGGGGGRGAGRPTICVHDCKETSSQSSDEETDEASLKNFQQLLAVQATPEQSAAFAIVVQSTQAASAQIHKFRELAEKSPGSFRS